MGRFGEHNTRTTDGSAAKMHVRPINWEAVFRRVLAHGRHHDPVSCCNGSEFEWAKKVWLSIALQDTPFIFGHY
jgi:hypothetical protein